MQQVSGPGLHLLLTRMGHAGTVGTIWGMITDDAGALIRFQMRAEDGHRRWDRAPRTIHWLPDGGWRVATAQTGLLAFGAASAMSLRRWSMAGRHGSKIAAVPCCSSHFTSSIFPGGLRS